MGQFSSSNQPFKGRGVAFKTKLLSVIRQQSLLEVTPSMSEPEVEALFLAHVAKTALSSVGSKAEVLLAHLLYKAYPTARTGNKSNVVRGSYSRHLDTITNIVEAERTGGITIGEAVFLIGVLIKSLGKSTAIS